MNNTIEKIKEICRENKIELSLLGVFTAAALLLCGPELAKEASVLYGNRAEQETEALTEEEQTTETEMQTETETETGTETEAVSAEEKARLHRKRLSQLGTDFRIPMVIVQEQEDGWKLHNLETWNQLNDYEMLAPEVNGLVPAGAFLSEYIQKNKGQDLSVLEALLEEKLASYDGEWSVYVKNLSTDEAFVIHDTPMKSASVMKLFIMGTVYEAFEAGELERTEETMALVNSMISYSDNEASNQLLYLLGGSSYADGISRVDAFIRTHGFSDMTIEYNGFNNSATNTSFEKYNQVSAKDCGKLLEDIYRRTWVNRAVSNEMEQMLLAQNTRYKIPAGIPEGVLCGNKTGEMNDTENDAAIIYAKECDYILVVLSNGWSSKDNAIYRIRDISGIVYEYLNAE